MDEFTVVEYCGYNESFHCDFCNGTSGKYSYGMWAHAMTCLDYQTLIDRGWRRSGVYCYKPDLEKSCCQKYTIRYRTLEYKLTKSKKKVLNKMKQFLESEGDDKIVNWKAKNAARNAEPKMKQSVENNTSETKASKVPMVLVDDSQLKTHQVASNETKKSIKAGLDADPSKPICIKAKVLRQQKRDLATASGDASSTTTSTSQQSKLKTLQEYVPHLLNSTDFKRKLEIRMVHAKIGNSEFEATREESYSLYKKYQQIIHGDGPSDCSEKQWIRFLVDCPFHRDKDGPGLGYGSYHQQYVLDGKIIAVGVVDVLPNCLSSVYLYYDPDYGFLSLGIYTALSEIAYTQTLYEESNDLLYYYMGFYIHSCQKMKYKRGFQPSDLLCPETYKWVPSELCFSLLDKEKYSRLNELNGGSATDVDQHSGREDFDMNEIGILHRSLLSYGAYTNLKYNALVKADQNHFDDINEELLESQKQAKNSELQNLKEYVSVVGTVCAKRMFVYRS